MMSLKQRTVSGFAWKFSGDLLNVALNFIIGIILARLLTPREYGLLGMVNIFIILAQPLLNSGFSQALIRKNKCTQDDFSTVFYFNFAVGVIFYFVLFFAAPNISDFFKEPQLTKVFRILGLIIIFDAVTLIQTTILTKAVNFKLLTRVSNATTIISGIFGIILAYKGFGIWSLVYRTIAYHFLRSILLWINNHWLPARTFSLSSFKELFGFGSNLLASGILDAVYYNIYNLVVAKFFSAKELGLFTRATMFTDLASTQFSKAISAVTFPALSTIQDEPDRLKRNYKTILNSSVFIIFTLMFALSGTSKSLILTLIGERWTGSISYLRLLPFVGAFYPMHNMMKNLLLVHGRSGLFFRLQIFAKTLSIPVILIGIFLGIKSMIYAMIAAGIIEYLVKAFYSGRLISYTVLNQLKDLIPSLLLALSIGITLFLIENLTEFSPISTLLIQTFIGAILFIGASELFKLKEYLFIKGIVIERIAGFNFRRKNNN